MNRSATARWKIIAILITLLLATSACFLTNLAQRTAGRDSTEAGTPTPLKTRTARVENTATAPAESTATPRPKATETQARQSTPRPVSTAVPSESGAEFAIEMTEEQLNKALLGNAFASSGIEIEDPRVKISPEVTTITFRAINQQPRVAVDITVNGMLVAHEGRAYYRVDGFDLGPSVSGLVRGVASAAIEKALEGYSTPHGIPVPTNRYEVLAVEQLYGKVRITGRTN